MDDDPLLLQLSSLNGSLDMARRVLADYPNTLLATASTIDVVDQTQLDKTKNMHPARRPGKRVFCHANFERLCAI